MDLHEFHELVQRNAPGVYPLIFGFVFEHRTICLRIVERRVNELLDDPTMTKKQLRAELRKCVQGIFDNGPS